MIIAITGTPGVGKSKVAKELKKILEDLTKERWYIIENKDIAKDVKVGYDRKRKCYIFDEKKIAKVLKKIEKEKKNIIFASHLSHFSKAKVCIILTCDIKELRKRLKRRKWKKEKIEENVQAEIFKICYLEAIENCKNTFVFDTTKKEASDVAKEIVKKIKKFLSK